MGRNEETSSERLAQKLEVKVEKVLVKLEAMPTKEDLRNSFDDHRKEYHSAKTMAPAGAGMFSPKMLTVLLTVIVALGIALATIVSSSGCTHDEETDPIQQ